MGEFILGEVRCTIASQPRHRGAISQTASGYVPKAQVGPPFYATTSPSRIGGEGNERYNWARRDRSIFPRL